MEEHGASSQFGKEGLDSAGKTALSEPKKVSRGNPRVWIIFMAVWILAAAYAGSHLKRGWIPHDEGAFAQSADRVLHGELPHRDYTEIYTGGLAYLHAFAFRYLGENFATPRIVLFVFFLLWVPAFYWIASRMVADWIAGCVTLLAVVWSLPMYPAAVPSWYNLFFATFGVAALFAYFSHRSTTWLFVAGLCGGCSFLAKSPALYYVAGVMLFFLFSEQGESLSKAAGAKSRSLLYSVFVGFSILLFLAGLAALIRGQGSAEELVDFVLPPSILATFVLLREMRATGRSSRQRFLALFRTILPFGLGFLVPLLVFLIPYLRENALHAVMNGVFLLPLKRISGAYGGPPYLLSLLPSIILISILTLSAWLRGRARWLLSCCTALLVVYYLDSSAYTPANYRDAWHAAYWMMPVVAVAGAFVLLRGPRSGDFFEHPLIRRQLFLILAVGSLCSLVQYPASGPIYFSYVAPLVILGVVAVLRAFPSIPRPLLAIVFSGFFLFAVLRVTPSYLYTMGYAYHPDRQTQVLNLARAGNLRVEPKSAKTYEELIPFIRERAGAGEIYAAQDCPEIYFLAGYRNPTRALFDFFEDDYRDGERVLRFLDSRSIHVIVLNKAPNFSIPLPFDVYRSLVRRFPEGRVIGHFEVRWRQ